MLFDACARRLKESELGLGVGEDEDVDGYAIKTIPHVVFLMAKSVQLQLYGVSHPPLPCSYLAYFQLLPCTDISLKHE